MTRQPAEAMRIDSERAVTRGDQTLDLKSEVPAAAESLQSCPTLCDPTEGFSRQEYWSGLPFPSPKEFFLKKIYLAALGLSFGKQDHQSSLQQQDFFVTCGI